MNEAKFTKGPWYTPGGLHYNEIYVQYEEDPAALRLIAELGPFDGSMSTRAANANLITVAPEMYKALEDAWHALVDAAEQLTTGSRQTPPESFLDKAGEIDMLLAKARGES